MNKNHHQQQSENYVRCAVPSQVNIKFLVHVTRVDKIIKSKNEIDRSSAFAMTRMWRTPPPPIYHSSLEEEWGKVAGKLLCWI